MSADQEGGTMVRSTLLLLCVAALFFAAGRDSLSTRLRIAELPEGIDPIWANPHGLPWLNDYAGMTLFGWLFAIAGGVIGIILLRTRNQNPK
jgi:hypothetical protein